jgi:hypothetical protein
MASNSIIIAVSVKSMEGNVVAYFKTLSKHYPKNAQDHQSSDQYSKPGYPRSETTIFSIHIYSF